MLREYRADGLADAALELGNAQKLPLPRITGHDDLVTAFIHTKYCDKLTLQDSISGHLDPHDLTT